MSMEIKFSGSTPLEALSHLTAFGMYCQCNEEIYTAARGIMESDRPAPANPQPVADLPAPAAPAPVAPAVPVAPVTPVAPAAPTAPVASPAPTTPVVPPAPAPAAPAPVVPLTAAPSFTAEQVGRAGSELISAHRELMPQLMALLGSYGVQAITDLTPEQLGPFATALRGMGAKI